MKQILSETFDSEAPAFEDSNNIKEEINQDVPNEDHSNNSEFYKLEVWKNQPLAIEDIKLMKPVLTNERKIPNYVESLINSIEIYPNSNKKREKQIIKLVEEIKRYNKPILNGILTRKYLKLKRLVNERSEFYNLKIESTASDFITKLEKRIHEAQRLGSTIDGTEITLKLLTENLMSHSKYNRFYQEMMVSNPGVAGVPNIVKLNNYKLMIHQFDENHKFLKRFTRVKKTGYILEEEKVIKDPKAKVDKNIKEIKCYKCGNLGHYANMCRNGKTSSVKLPNKMNCFKNKFKPKSYKTKGYNKGCYKCGGNHKTNECNYDFKKIVNLNLKKNKRLSKSIPVLDNIELLPNEDEYQIKI